MIKSFAN